MVALKIWTGGSKGAGIFNWVISIEKHTTEDYIDTNIETGKKEVFTRVSTHMYKLNPEIYQALKYSMTAYGKISNFDE